MKKFPFAKLMAKPDDTEPISGVSGAEPPVVAVAAKSTIALTDADVDVLAQVGPAIRRGAVLAGRYRVLRLIGSGGQCYVYEAEHVTLKSRVAIKCLQPQFAAGELVERFAREAQALTVIRNAHVAAVLDVGRASCGTPYIVMEFLQGKDLAGLLQTRPQLTARQATEILLQACEGLAAAHALGLVHQDIKPGNIFLSEEMGLVKAKIVDFGVARVSPTATQSRRGQVVRSKLDESIGGTPFYMPPEQFFPETVVDARSDIFALGMVLYEMLRGTVAFDREMSARSYHASVRVNANGLDPELVSIVEKCLEYEPQARYRSVAELAIALVPFAPSRARVHADAACKLLRAAGVTVEQELPLTIPPPKTDPSPKATWPSPVIPRAQVRSVSKGLVVALIVSSGLLLAAAVILVLVLRAPKPKPPSLELARPEPVKPIESARGPERAPTADLAPSEPRGADSAIAAAPTVAPTATAVPVAAKASGAPRVPSVSTSQRKGQSKGGSRTSKSSSSSAPDPSPPSRPVAPSPAPRPTADDLGF